VFRLWPVITSSNFFEGAYPCALSSNVFDNYHVFCIFFLYRLPGQFEPRQKRSRAINEQEEEVDPRVDKRIRMRLHKVNMIGFVT